MAVGAELRRDGKDPCHCLNLALFFCPREVVAGLAEGEGCMFSVCSVCVRMEAKHQPSRLPGTRVVARDVFQCRKSFKILSSSAVVGCQQ